MLQKRKLNKQLVMEIRRWSCISRTLISQKQVAMNVVNNANNLWYRCPRDAARLYQLQADILQCQIVMVEGLINRMRLAYLESTQQEKYLVLKTVRTSKWLVEFARWVEDPSAFFPGYKP